MGRGCSKWDPNWINERLNDVGEGTLGMLPPLVLNPKRVGVRYGSEGGSEADGVMFIRLGRPRRFAWERKVCSGSDTGQQRSLSKGNGDL